MRILLSISILLALAGHPHAVSTSDGDINQMLVLKLQTIEQKLAVSEQVKQELASKLEEYRERNDAKQAGYQQVNDELAAKLARYEQRNDELASKMTKYQQIIDKLLSAQGEMKADQEANQRTHQSEVQSLRGELEVKEKQYEEIWQKQEKFIQDLQMSMEVLQTKLQSTRDECSSMKVQLIKFFVSVSSAKNLQRKQKRTGDNSTVVDVEGEGQSGASNTDYLYNNGTKETINPNTEAISQEYEDEDNSIIATLQIDATGGVSYIRWGRTLCEGDAKALYTGYAAGKYKGGTQDYVYSTGGEIICLHGAPQWGDINTIYKGDSPISGVEYHFHNDDPFSKENVGGQSLVYHNMPCTVCHVETRSHQLMIPGRNSCPNGWTMEYRGYLVVSDWKTWGGIYQCLDEAPESATGGAAAQGWIQYVNAAEINCAGLPCAPFFQGYEISCVVCSK